MRRNRILAARIWSSRYDALLVRKVITSLLTEFCSTISCALLLELES